jgi:mycothiol S-conjugate amidase
MNYRLLALHAHPDDESSKGAGTVARYADAGVEAVLLTATGGEAGDILNPSMDAAAVRRNLSDIRRRELEEAAAIIGFHEIVLLGYRDSGMPDTADNDHPDAFVNAAFDDVLGRVVNVVRRVRPHVVLGYDAHEWYPHPDHLRIHELSLALGEAAADPDRFPEAGDPWKISKLYAPAWTVRRTRALHEAMEELGLESPFGRRMERLDEFGDHGKRLTSIDVSDQIDRARAALRAHRTQVDPDGFWFRIPLETVRDSYPFEDFELLESRGVWDAAETDLFAGVQPA